MFKTHSLCKRFGFGLAVAVVFLTLGSSAAATDAVTPAEAAAMIKQKKDLQLIDVRTEAEYADGHLAGAKLIPVQELEQRVAEIDKKKPVLLYCRSGHRSGNALKILQDHGYAQAKHLEGGIKAWQAAGMPVTK
jgi:rhodanese-related sulfurtransferase